MKIGKRDEDGRLAEINIIPLVDIMLVLLIIFMVTAPMLKEGIDIQLPEVSADSVNSAEDDFTLTIDVDGRIFLNDDTKQKFSVVTIESKLLEIFKDKPKKQIYLKADESVNYGYVVQVMAACQRAGVEKIGMITQPPENDKKKKVAKR